MNVPAIEDRPYDIALYRSYLNKCYARKVGKKVAPFTDGERAANAAHQHWYRETHPEYKARSQVQIDEWQAANKDRMRIHTKKYRDKVRAREQAEDAAFEEANK